MPTPLPQEKKAGIDTGDVVWLHPSLPFFAHTLSRMALIFLVGRQRIRYVYVVAPPSSVPDAHDRVLRSLSFASLASPSLSSLASCGVKQNVIEPGLASPLVVVVLLFGRFLVSGRASSTELGDRFSSCSVFLVVCILEIDQHPTSFSLSIAASLFILTTHPLTVSRHEHRLAPFLDLSAYLLSLLILTCLSRHFIFALSSVSRTR